MFDNQRCQAKWSPFMLGGWQRKDIYISNMFTIISTLYLHHASTYIVKHSVMILAV